MLSWQQLRGWRLLRGRELRVDHRHLPQHRRHLHVRQLRKLRRREPGLLPGHVHRGSGGLSEQQLRDLRHDRPLNNLVERFAHPSGPLRVKRRAAKEQRKRGEAADGVPSSHREGVC